MTIHLSPGKANAEHAKPKQLRRPIPYLLPIVESKVKRERLPVLDHQ